MLHDSLHPSAPETILSQAPAQSSSIACWATALEPHHNLSSAHKLCSSEVEREMHSASIRHSLLQGKDVGRGEEGDPVSLTVFFLLSASLAGKWSAAGAESIERMWHEWCVGGRSGKEEHKMYSCCYRCLYYSGTTKLLACSICPPTASTFMNVKGIIFFF